MEDDLTCPKRKIIQKRVKKRERYARMARIRYRKERNVPLAKFEYLPSPINVICSKPLYHFYLDFILFEDNGTLTTSFSVINKIKLCNCISLIGEDGEDQTLCLKFNDIQNSVQSNWVEVVENWENRSDPYWKTWASQLRKFSLDYEKFLNDYTKMLEEESFDKKFTQRYQSFMTKRNQLMNKRACVEVKFRLDNNQIKYSEFNITSKLLDRLNYDMEEFAECIFKGEFPKCSSYQSKSSINTIGLIMEHFNEVFYKDLEIFVEDAYLTTKNEKVKKTSYSLYMAGYFVKRLPEISVIVVYDDGETEIKSSFLTDCYSQFDSTVALQQENELKEFLKKFYNEENLSSFMKSEEICKVKPLDPMKDEQEGIREKIEVKQEIDWNSPDSKSQGKEIKPIQISFPNFTTTSIAQNLWNFTNSLNQFTSSLRYSDGNILRYYNNSFYY